MVRPAWTRSLREGVVRPDALGIARRRGRAVPRGRGLHRGRRVTCESPSAEREGTIVVGVSGAFAENQIVAEMYAQVLEHAGYTVERQLDLRSREVSQNALESGQIDLKPEYLSSLLLFVDPNAEASNDPDDVAEQAPRSPGAARDHGADAIAGRGHEPVRGERGDGRALRPDHDDVPRPRREPADVRRAARVPAAALLPPRTARASTGSSSTTSSRSTSGGRRPSRRSRATRCRSGCCSPPTRASRRTGSCRSWTTGTCRTRRTSRR